MKALVTIHSPTKRGLKDDQLGTNFREAVQGYNPFPDEKGTESRCLLG